MPPFGPEISVLVATYNRAGYLENCVNSLLEQSLPKQSYEILVVNDGSTDSTGELLDGYRKQIRVLHLGKHQGVEHACNAGLSQAKGRFLIRVDSDDWLERRALERMLQAASEDGGQVILVPDYWEVRGSRRRRVAAKLKNIFSWLAAGVLMPVTAVRRVGGYRSFFWEEFDLYLRLLEQGTTPRHLPEALLFYRRHRFCRTADRKARANGWKELLSAWPREVLLRYGSHQELEQQMFGGGRSR